MWGYELAKPSHNPLCFSIGVVEKNLSVVRLQVTKHQFIKINSFHCGYYTINQGVCQVFEIIVTFM